MPRTLIAAAALSALAWPATQAATLSGDGSWAAFDVDALSAASGGLEWIDIGTGAAIRFDFTIAAGQVGTLTVVDAGFAGDRFQVFDGVTLLGATSDAQDSYPDSLGLDFDAALARADYSRGAWTLGAGSYSISGFLLRSATVDGIPLDATVGGVRLTVSPVPEPAPLTMLVAGLALVAFARRRG